MSLRKQSARMKGGMEFSFVALALGWFLGISGCNGRSHADYVPDSTPARAALITALESWKSGGNYDSIKSGKPAVEPHDSDWMNGRKLESFDVVKELPTQEGPKQFAVQLKFEDADESEEVVYFVLGRDPLLVYRGKDFEKASGM